jgi:hypothetical protein
MIQLSIQTQALKAVVKTVHAMYGRRRLAPMRSTWIPTRMVAARKIAHPDNAEGN